MSSFELICVTVKINERTINIYTQIRTHILLSFGVSEQIEPNRASGSFFLISPLRFSELSLAFAIARDCSLQESKRVNARALTLGRPYLFDCRANDSVLSWLVFFFCSSCIPCYSVVVGLCCCCLSAVCNHSFSLPVCKCSGCSFRTIFEWRDAAAAAAVGA